MKTFYCVFNLFIKLSKDHFIHPFLGNIKFSLIQMKIEIDSTEVLALKKLLDNNYISEAYIFSLKHFQT